MKKRILSLLIVLLIPILVLCGCGTKNKDYKEYSNSRFVFVGEYEQIETPNGNNTDFYLLVDKETRIIYLYLTGVERAGITPLLDKNGNVTYYKGNLEE